MIRAAVAVLLIGWANVGYSATFKCEGSAYERGLCWYTEGELDRAEVELAAIIAEDPHEPEMPKAVYFLARTKMKRKMWHDASELLIRLFELSPAFYREWNADYLLGVCREAEGRD